MVKEHLQVPYQAISQYTPSYYPCFSGILFLSCSSFSSYLPPPSSPFPPSYYVLFHVFTG